MKTINTYSNGLSDIEIEEVKKLIFHNPYKQSMIKNKIYEEIIIRDTNNVKEDYRSWSDYKIVNTYDQQGNLLSIKKFDYYGNMGLVKAYEYDSIGLQIKETWGYFQKKNKMKIDFYNKFKYEYSKNERRLKKIYFQYSTKSDSTYQTDFMEYYFSENFLLDTMIFGNVKSNGEFIKNTYEKYFYNENDKVVKLRQFVISKENKKVPTYFYMDFEYENDNLKYIKWYTGYNYGQYDYRPNQGKIEYFDSITGLKTKSNFFSIDKEDSITIGSKINTYQYTHFKKNN